MIHLTNYFNNNGRNLNKISLKEEKNDKQMNEKKFKFKRHALREIRLRL